MQYSLHILRISFFHHRNLHLLRHWPVSKGGNAFINYYSSIIGIVVTSSNTQQTSIKTKKTHHSSSLIITDAFSSCMEEKKQNCISSLFSVRKCTSHIYCMAIFFFFHFLFCLSKITFLRTINAVFRCDILLQLLSCYHTIIH